MHRVTTAAASVWTVPMGARSTAAERQPRKLTEASHCVYKSSIKVRIVLLYAYLHVAYNS